ncbi:unnamed protein product [Ambrosiozyma monospora]|uniref:Unnamed protein product n=1 Tax=Ambrosiozyma monospora TaxID=43982 RepID=A0ACB5SSH2_AMBMO|nr:unnamed protein product [Ambrosiozyma monospora]
MSHRTQARQIPAIATIPEDKSFGFAKAILTEKKLKRMPSNLATSRQQTCATSIMSDGRLSKLAPSFQFTEGSVNNEGTENEDSYVIEEEGDLELELEGPPWVKEGLQYAIIGDEILGKEKNGGRHSSWFSKRSSQKWKNVFTVASQGKVRLFSFEGSSKHQKSTMPTSSGDGSWYNYAKCLVSVNLCSCFAQFVDVESKLHAKLTYNYGFPTNKKTGFETFWVLNLPLTDSNSFSSYRRIYFCAGTSEIASEFVETCNFWSARSSQVPQDELISSDEFGWSPKLVELCDAISDTSTKNANPTAIEEFISKSTFSKWTPTIYGLIPANYTMTEQIQKLRQHYQDLTLMYKQHKALETHLEKLHIVFNKNNSNSNYYSNINRIFGSRSKENKDHISKSIKLIRLNYVNKLNYLENELLRYKKYISTLENAIKLRRERFLSSDSLES